MQPTELFDYAIEMNKNIASSGDKYQVIARNIIGIAYYSALLLASDFLSQPTTGQDGHANITRNLQKKNSLIGNALNKARLLRHKADYQLKETFTSKDIAAQLTDCGKVLNYIKSEQSK